MTTARLIPSAPPEVGAALDAVDPRRRAWLMGLRDLILSRATELPEIGPVTEGLRWGQPAFLTPETRAASSLRIAPHGPAHVGLFVHCRTDLIERFRGSVGADFLTEGRRAVLFDGSDFDPEPIRLLVGWTLTYHLPVSRQSSPLGGRSPRPA